MDSTPIRVFMMEDQNSFIDGFSLHCDFDPEIELVGAASNGYECLTKTHNQALDIIVLDIKIQNKSTKGFQIAQEIIKRYQRENRPQPAIVFLSEHTYLDYRNKAVNLGASFLPKDAKMVTLLEWLKEVHHAQCPVIKVEGTQEMTEGLKEEKRLAKELQEVLTPSEGQVAVHLPICEFNEDIATKLSTLNDNREVKKDTVARHLTNAYSKLGLERDDKKRTNPRQQLKKMMGDSGLVEYVDDINRNPQAWFGNRRTKRP